MTSADNDPIDVALRVAGVLEELNVEYFVGGSLASSVDGEPRATNDIDFVVDLPLGRIAPFVSALGTDFEVDVDMLREAVRTGRCANGFYLPTVLKLDFFGHAHGPFDNSEFARRRKLEVRPGRTLFVKSPEDTILRKLLWYKEGGGVSDKQWRDILGVLSAQRERLDFDYIGRWTDDLGISDLFQRARVEGHGD